MAIRSLLPGCCLMVLVRRLRCQWRCVCYVNAPEMRNDRGEQSRDGIAARDFVRQLLPVGATVRLWGPGDTLQADGHGRVLAVVLLDDGTSIQERLIAAGWSVYWQRYGTVGDADWHQRWTEQAAVAEHYRRGMWQRDAAWMRRLATQRRRQ